MEEVAVIIPLYQEKLQESDLASLRQSYSEFKDYPVIVACPQGLNISFYSDEFPNLQWEEFSQEYFRDIQGYNRLMLSEEFYARFANKYEYILICQTDVWIFHGRELADWCSKGYDYVGAPWVMRDVYGKFPLKQWMRYDAWKKHRNGLRCRQDLWGKVGNGGLSLRKVQSHLDVLRENKELIEYYLSCGKPFYAEDIFWGVEPKTFRYPTQEEALQFAFDKDPDYCYYKNNFELPFGCHAWNKGRNARFWLPMLGFAPKSNKMSRYPIN